MNVTRTTYRVRNEKNTMKQRRKSSAPAHQRRNRSLSAPAGNYRLPDVKQLDPIPSGKAARAHNKTRRVTLRKILVGEAWTQTRMELPLAIGRDVAGKDLVFDLAQAPHLLIAGATGSGKSVCVNAMLAGLLMSRRPDELRLLLVDPRRIEFSTYNNLPHLVAPVVTDTHQVVPALHWALAEMDRRYKLLQAATVRNIGEYNAREVTGQLPNKVTDGGIPTLPAKLPYIVVVLDEVADLLIVVGEEIEQLMIRLAKLSKAVGIHMILATQRPYKHVLTNMIKANFPGRIAFQVAQKADSLTIIDQPGAEALNGRGDMLFLCPQQSGQVIRVQGAWVNDGEVKRVTYFARSQGEPDFDEVLMKMIREQQTK